MSALKKIKYLLAIITILFSLIIAYFITYHFVEPKTYDIMTRYFVTQKLPFHNKQIYGSNDIVLIVIDDKTLEKYRWPWRRDLYCKLFNYFSQYTHPEVITYDAIFSTLDNNNPNADKKYFKSLKKIDNLVVGFSQNVKYWENEENGKIYDKLFTKFSIKNIEDKTTSINNLYSSLLPFPIEYLNSVKHAGSVTMIPGFLDGNIKSYAVDEIYRTHEYLIKYKGNLYPSLAMETFLIKYKNPEIINTNNNIIFPSLNYKIHQKTTKYQSISPIKYYKLYNNGYSHTKVSASEIMNSYDDIQKGKTPKINSKFFNNKIVIIGANVPSGTSLNDNKNTPMISNHPGVDIQATIIDNIIHNDFLKIIPNWLNLLITLLGMITIYTVIRIHDLIKSISSSLCIIVGYIFTSIICYYFSIVINVSTPVVMFIITMLIAYTHKFVLENKSKEKVKNAMGKYMSEDVMKRVVMNIDHLGLGGKKATVTVLFADIRGFTSMSEKMSAEEVSEILNEYFTEMEPIITKYNGIINKFIGDAIMAIFGEPIQDKNHPANAVKCGYEMLLKVRELQKKWANEGKPKIQIGVGINTGEVFVGNIGSINRMEYTVIGDTVNLASRLESYNKIYRTKMLISSSTYALTKGIIDTIKISDVEIRGKANKMDIYEVLKINNYN